MPHLFWDMTAAETSAIAQGVRDREKQEWKRTANIVAMVRNTSWAVKGYKSAQSLFPFAFEDEVYFADEIPDGPKSSHAEFNRRVRYHREVFKKQNLN